VCGADERAAERQIVFEKEESSHHGQGHRRQEEREGRQGVHVQGRPLVQELVRLVLFRLLVHFLVVLAALCLLQCHVGSKNLLFFFSFSMMKKEKKSFFLSLLSFSLSFHSFSLVSSLSLAQSEIA
jgi:hypothetical protein